MTGTRRSCAPGIFITGTDTGVGKTVVACALALALRRRGVRVGVMKPAESGCQRENGRLVPRDAIALRQAAGCAAPLEMVNPYTLAEPLTPALAAEATGIDIDIDHIRACYQLLAVDHDLVLVEGAGGLLSPLNDEATMADLAYDLDLPVLIVAGNVLGVINHTTLTVQLARQRGLRVLGTILNDVRPDSDRATQSNGAALRRWGGAGLLAELPYTPDLTKEALSALGERLPLERIRKDMSG